MIKVGIAVRWAAIIAWAAVHIGCSQQNEAGLVASAKVAIDKGDLKTATIELKNVLKDNPVSIEGRSLLGRTLLESGNPVAAEVELRKAKELTPEATQWAPLLARSMLVQSKFGKVVEEFGNLELPDKNAQAALSASVAAALAGMGQREKAHALIESTLARSPENVAMLLLKARLLSRPGDLGESISLVEKVLASRPRHEEAWQLLGDLQLFGNADIAKAADAYNKVLGLRPDAVDAHASLIFSRMLAGDIPGARKHLDVMVKVLPNYPQTKLLEAKVAFLEGKTTRARELTQQLLLIAPNHAPLLELAAAIELKLNSLQQAETYLNKALAKAPDMPSARRMLADVLMRNGKPGKALEVLGPNLAAGKADSISLSQAAEAHLQNGNVEKAEQFFRLASKLAPADPKYRTALALTQLAKGRTDAAFSELRAISAAAPDTLADLTLITALSRRRDYEGVLQAIDGLERKQPDKPLAANLRGRIQLTQGNLSAARKSFEQALAKDPVYLPAIANLAAIDQAEGKPDVAEKRYRALLEIDPKNVQAYIALAVMKDRGGNSKDKPEAVGLLLDKAVQSDPSDPSPRLLLIQHWLQLRNIKAAQTVAQAGVLAMPENVDMQDALGSLQLVTGDVNQSISTFNKIAARQPNSTKAYLRLADAYLQANDYASAGRSFKRVLEIAPDTISAQRGLIALSVRARQSDQALAIARDIQRARPNDSDGYLMEGDIYVEFKDMDSALKAYRAGSDKAGSLRLMERLYAATVAVKGKAEASRLAEDWNKRHPDDSRFSVFLGNNAVNANDLPMAERFYSDALRANPNHPSAVNNLAWVKAKLGRPGAVALAEKAVSLAPGDAAMLDTLAFALASENQLGKAVETAKAVVAISPGEPVYQLNLAKLYIKAGDRPHAKAELERLVPLGSKFQRQSEVGELMRSLSE